METVVNQMEHQSHVVLGISGSLRKQSSNTWLLSSIGGMMPAGMEFRIYEGLASLPHFSPDLDGDESQSLEAVGEWREELRAADAIVIVHGNMLEECRVRSKTRWIGSFLRASS
jgi:chromate reductase